MISQRRLVLAGLIGAALAAGVVLVAQRDPGADPPGLQAKNPQANVYSVKFLCGVATPPPPGTTPPTGAVVEPGSYRTLINVHNPNAEPVIFFKKAVVLAPTRGFEEPQPPHPFHEARLDGNWGLSIDCEDIKMVLADLGTAAAFFDGYVVIMAGRLLLDVSVVYTARGTEPTADTPSIDVEQIEPKRVHMIQPTTTGGSN